MRGVSLRALLATVAIQLATLLAPIAAGLAGVISGPAAGLASILAWFLAGIPLSYSLLDAQTARRAPAHAQRDRREPVPGVGIATAR